MYRVLRNPSFSTDHYNCENRQVESRFDPFSLLMDSCDYDLYITIIWT
jgi:hypothetical protein